MSSSDQASLAACVAHLTGEPPTAVPLDPDELTSWLAQRRLGLVPIAEAAAFAWPGPWIAWRAATEDDDADRRAVVMFGVPSGVIFEPVATGGEILGGVLLAPLDVADWTSAPSGVAGVGTVTELVVAPTAEADVRPLEQATALPGRGLDGDRYAAGSGTFGSGRPGSALTLVDEAVLDALAAERGGAVDHRRNVVVRGADLNALVGRRFRVGEVVCLGRRLCEPCAHLDRLNGGGVLRPLVHRGGLRADIVAGGPIRVGDRVEAID